METAPSWRRFRFGPDLTHNNHDAKADFGQSILPSACAETAPVTGDACPIGERPMLTLLPKLAEIATFLAARS